MDILTEDIK